MNYKITEHYARGEEKLIAEFKALSDARLFMTRKLSTAEEARKNIIYRLYNDHGLLNELNKENISVTHAKYAEGNSDFNNAVPCIFKIQIKPVNALESETIALFNDKNDAFLFVVCKFETNPETHDGDLFFIFKDKILVDTLNKTIIAIQKQQTSSSADGEKKYKLSPLSTRPTPKGGPGDHWVEIRDDDG